MKNLQYLFLSLLLSFFLITSTFAGEDLYVIHVKGNVSNKATGVILKIGDKINSEDQLKFATQDALVVIMSAKGKYTLSPSAKPNNSNEFIAYVNNAMLPLKSNGHLSTRGNGSDLVHDLKAYFGTSTFNIIGEQLELKIDTLKYPLTDSKYLIYRYMNNGTVVSKKIEKRGGQIIINKLALYTYKGNFIDPSKIQNVDIYYYESKDNKSSRLVGFNPQFINEEQLKSELWVQKKILEEQNVKSDQITKELVSYVFDVYGKTDESKLVDWIHKSIK
jgi:hypothetical protein